MILFVCRLDTRIVLMYGKFPIRKSMWARELGLVHLGLCLRLNGTVSVCVY